MRTEAMAINVLYPWLYMTTRLLGTKTDKTANSIPVAAPIKIHCVIRYNHGMTVRVRGPDDSVGCGPITAPSVGVESSVLEFTGNVPIQYHCIPQPPYDNNDCTHSA